MRFSTAASGTSLTRTQIFTGSGPPVTERAFASYPDACPIDLSVNRAVPVAPQGVERVARHGAAPVGLLGGRRGREVEGPASVRPLAGGEVLEVGGDGGGVEQRARDRVGAGGGGERAGDPAGGGGGERPGGEHRRGHPGQRGGRAGAGGDRGGGAQGAGGGG